MMHCLGTMVLALLLISILVQPADVHLQPTAIEQIQTSATFIIEASVTQASFSFSSSALTVYSELLLEVSSTLLLLTSAISESRLTSSVSSELVHTTQIAVSSKPFPTPAATNVTPMTTNRQASILTNLISSAGTVTASSAERVPGSRGPDVGTVSGIRGSVSDSLSSAMSINKAFSLLITPSSSSVPSSDTSTNSAIAYIQRNPAVIVLTVALLLAIAVIIACGGAVFHQRRSQKRSSYDIPTVSHGPPNYSLSQMSFGITSLANQDAIYEAMPDTNSINMEMSTGTFKEGHRTSTAPPINPTRTQRDGQPNLDSVYELNNEKETKSGLDRKDSVATGATSANPSKGDGTEGIYELDGVERHHKTTSSGGHTEGSSILKDDACQDASFYEMDDPV